jgi:para-nitrobenzyl esterase
MRYTTIAARSAFARLYISMTACALLQTAPLVSAQAALPEPLKIDSGQLSGIEIGAGGKPVRAYLGVPYAAPPLGDLRWREPREPGARNVIRARPYSSKPRMRT